MYELIKFEVVNGAKKSYEELSGTIFTSMAEMEKFRKKIKEKYPECEVYLTYKENL